MEKRFSFRKGWAQLPRNKVAKAKEAIKSALAIRSDQAFYNRMNGKIIPKVPEKEIIEGELVKNGVPAESIWGEEN